MLDYLTAYSEAYGALIGPLLTILIFVFGALLQRKARKLEKLMQNEAQKFEQLVQERTQKVQEIMVWNEFREPILEFANEAVSVLSSAEDLCELNPSTDSETFKRLRRQILTDLSSLRDKGKFLLPNSHPDTYGILKASAYRGFRHDALSCLAAAFHLVIAIDFKLPRHNRDKVNLRAYLEYLGIPALIYSNSGLRHSVKHYTPLQQKIETLPSDRQLLKITEALCLLPNPANDHTRSLVFNISGPFNAGWSVKAGIVEAKRRFVSIIQETINTPAWNRQLQEMGFRTK